MENSFKNASAWNCRRSCAPIKPNHAAKCAWFEKMFFLWRRGRRGTTNVHLASAKKKMLQTALNAAGKMPPPN